ncbi:TonB-dependent receptor [Desulfobacter curvatus]|uniref:TonB-dependent receptor n=1 Tax=Desulfobacter curvatus TaxID=2290 RepID=UPI000363317C|nr:TonB-dependent receptor [Desulfobacter curvatus]
MKKCKLSAPLSLLVLALVFSLCPVALAGGSSGETQNPEGIADSADPEKTLDTIVVTAQKRSESVKNVPASITVLDAAIIEDASVDGMEGISDLTPGLEFYNAGSRRHAISFMRGIKSIHGGEPAIGYYVDGVSYSKSYMFDFPLFDVEQIEVLKGPQGCLYGRNAMAGVINVRTSEPGNEVRSKIEASYGSEDLMEFKGTLQAPVVQDRFFVGIAALARQQDGYMENDVETSGDEGRHTDGGGGRLKLRFLPSDMLDMNLVLDGQTWDEGVFPLRRTERNAFVQKGVFKSDPAGHYSHDFEGTSDTDVWGASLNVNYTLPIGILTSITGYRDYQVDELLDADFSSLDMTRMNYIQEDKGLTQELRLASDPSGSRFNWLGGLYFYDNDSVNHTTTYYRPAMAGNPGNPFGTNTGSSLNVSDGTSRGAAVFGQGTVKMLNKLDLTLGLRYEYEDADMHWTKEDTPDGGSTTTTVYPDASDDFDALIPKASLAWHFTDSHMVYATFSGGHRSGGFNKLAPAGGTAYDDETSWLYEIGGRLEFLNGRLALDLSGFYMDLEDEQIALFDTDLNTSYISNAGESHRLGLEAEARLTPVTGLDLSAGLTVLEAEYDQYADPVLGTDYAGNQVFNVPEVSGNIGVQYRHMLTGNWSFFGRLDIVGYGKRYLDDANTVKENPYALVHAKVGLETEKMDIYLWGRNLLDREYIVFENTAKGIAEDGEPLTAGVTVSYRF